MLCRIAIEAGAQMRSVLYYFGSREQLLVRVVHNPGGQITALTTIKDICRSLGHDQILALQRPGWTLRGDVEVSASALSRCYGPASAVARGGRQRAFQWWP